MKKKKEKETWELEKKIKKNIQKKIVILYALRENILTPCLSPEDT